MTDNKRNKTIFLLPNLFTTAALFAGFYAIITAMMGLYEKSVIALIIAGCLDGLDGRVARMTNTQSEFGAQYDSMSDLIAFGVAPSLVAFTWALQYTGKFGWAVAFVFVACAAIRLARFNTQIGETDPRYFIGLPSPAAAGTLATAVWVGVDHNISGESVAWLVLALTLFIGLCMVSNFQYSSFKEFNKNKIPVMGLLVVVLGFSLILIHPPLVLTVIGFLYALSGIVNTLLLKKASK